MIQSKFIIIKILLLARRHHCKRTILFCSPDTWPGSAVANTEIKSAWLGTTHQMFSGRLRLVHPYVCTDRTQGVLNRTPNEHKHKQLPYTFMERKISRQFSFCDEHCCHCNQGITWALVL